MLVRFARREVEDLPGRHPTRHLTGAVQHRLRAP
jgi:hypothetical protein